MSKRIKFHYWSFQVWRDHIDFAHKYYPELEEYCVRHLIDKALDVLLYQYGKPTLTDENLAIIKSMLKKYRSVSLPKEKSYLRYFLLDGWPFIRVLMGKRKVASFYFRSCLCKWPS